MSQSNSDKPITVAEPLKAKTADDIFGALSEGDDLESLDLTKPIGDKPDKEKDKTDDKPEKDDTLEVDDKDEITDKDDKEEVEIDELQQIEEDLKEVDEEKLELKTPVARREILKKYPNLFKDFPYLETAYYREQQFTEILSTIDDAKAAAESHQILQRYTEDMVEKGNVKNVLKMIKDSNPETYAQVVDNYMEHLREFDPQAHVHVQSNLVKNLILGMVEEARTSNDDDLRTAALLLNKWAFGSAKFTPPQRMAKETPPEDKTKEAEITKREQEFNERVIRTATTEVNTRVNNAIKGAIENNIDPNGSMTDYVKRNAVRDAQEKITNLIEKDTRFQKIVEKLWEKAAKNNFSTDSQNEIRKAFLSKAKSLLAPVIQSARKEALKGMGKRVKEETEEEGETTQPRRERIERTQERSLSSDRIKARLEQMPRGASSFDKLNALMGD
jgi:hypothetical protein